MKNMRFATLCAALGLASFLNLNSHAQITVDGTKEAAYGSPLSTQTLTGWGANNSLASLSAVQQGGSLFVFLAGRPQGNAFILFVDSKPGGVTFIPNNLITGGGEESSINNFGSSASAGMTFETGFEPDYAIRIYGEGAGGTGAWAAVYPLTAGASRSYIGDSGSSVGASGGVVTLLKSSWENVSNVSTASKGSEIQFSITQLGVPNGSGQSVKFMAMLVNGGSDYGSNQVLGPLPSGAGDLGSGMRTTNFNTVAGTQTISITVDNTDTDGDGIGDATDPDDDNDGLSDTVETNTGTFVDATNTGTNPVLADTDGDGYNDGAEVNGTSALGRVTDPLKKNYATMLVAGDFLAPPWSDTANATNTMTRVSEYGYTLNYNFRSVPSNNIVSFKFVAGNWNNNWGYGAPSVAQRNGADIPFFLGATGFYTFTFDHDALSYSLARTLFLTYSDYAQAYGLTEGESGDEDVDGLSNGTEFTMNTDPTRINDVTPPWISLASGVASLTWVARGGSLSLSVNDVQIYDNYDPSPFVSISPAGLDTSTDGFVTVTYTATDSAGNSSTFTRLIAVGDVTAPYHNLQWPPAMTITSAGSGNVYAQIFVAGVTPGSGPAPAIQAWVGVHTENTDPATWSSSAWTAATYLGESGNFNNDEYMATLSGSGLSLGTYYYAVRWQIGGGAYFYSGITTGGDGGAWGTSVTDNSTTPPTTSTRGNGVLTVVPVRDVTFAVDMGGQIAKGAFNPATDIVEVRGDFNGWLTGVSPLARDGTSSIYRGTFSVQGAENSTSNYKFWFYNGLGNWEVVANRQILLGAGGVAQTLAVAFFSNDDGLGPVITLNGADPLNLSLGDTFTDPGATATDAIDGSVTVTSSGTVNTAIPGTYTITYNASDAAGNAATTVTRTVVVSSSVSSSFANWGGGVSLNSANLAKYAFGGASSPTANDGTEPTVTTSGGNLLMTVIVRTNDPKLLAVGRVTTSLAPDAAETLVNGVEAADQSNVPVGCKRMVYSVPQGSDGRKFLRVTATLQP